MVEEKENRSERIFSELCGRQYLKGFVFHSPKYDDPTEKEAGDIVLWVRNMMIVFEVVWRNSLSAGSTKQFVKRIGEKREQLISGFNAYSEKGDKIRLVNEVGNTIKYDQDVFHKENFMGVVLVDSDVDIENIHFQTLNKLIDLEFPIAVMKKSDFTDLIVEIDTIPDLVYYLKDRHEYFKSVYIGCPQAFLNLNIRTERNLIALYKLGNNSFNKGDSKNLIGVNLWAKYRNEFKEKIEARDKENRKTKIIDNLIEMLLHEHSSSGSTLLHAWELGILSRRERVSFLAEKIEDAICNMKAGKERRQFAFFCQATGCWSVFYFQFGETVGSLRSNLVKMAKLKLFKEIVENSFGHSVFGYGFRKSSVETSNDFDEVSLWIEDANNYSVVPKEQYTESLNYFGKPKPKEIREFPV